MMKVGVEMSEALVEVHENSILNPENVPEKPLFLQLPTISYKDVFLPFLYL